MAKRDAERHPITRRVEPFETEDIDDGNRVWALIVWLVVWGLALIALGAALIVWGVERLT